MLHAYFDVFAYKGTQVCVCVDVLHACIHTCMYASSLISCCACGGDLRVLFLLEYASKHVRANQRQVSIGERERERDWSGNDC